MHLTLPAKNTDSTSAIKSATESHIRKPPHKSVRADEDGHDIFKIQPMTKHSGVSVCTWLTGLFQVVVAISTLGASITFSYVIGRIKEPVTTVGGKHRRWGHDEVQLFLGICWLLFLLGIAFAALASTLLTFFRDH